MMMASEPFVPQIISRACSASNVLEAPVDLETALAIEVKELVANTTDLDKVHLQRTHIDAILHKINGKDKIDYEKDPKLMNGRNKDMMTSSLINSKQNCTRGFIPPSLVHISLGLPSVFHLPNFFKNTWKCF